MGSLLFRFLMGALAGMVAWLIFAPFTPSSATSTNWAQWEQIYVLVLGGTIGLVVGGLDGYNRGGRQHTLRGLGLGLILGAIGVMFGYSLFGSLATSIFGSQVFETAGFSLAVIPARILTFTGIGLCLGAAIGGSSLNTKKLIQGAIGGAIAGAISGAAFDPVSQVLGPAIQTMTGSTEVGVVARAIMAVLLGGGIALFIGIVDRMARSAWLRLSLGRNEGREWSIDSNQTFIGRSEGAQVPLFGDPNIASIHASIQKQGGQYLLVDGGSPVGTLLNGQFIQQAPLFHGAQITIGSYVLQFLMKNQQAPVRGPEAFPGQAYSLQPQQGQPQPQPVAAFQGMPGQGMSVQGMPTQAMPMQPGMPTQALQPQPSMPTVAYGAPMQAAPGAIAIIAIDGPLMGQRFVVNQAMDLGRECPAVPMSFDTAASRRHATLAPAPNGLSVADAGSTNGTFVNGQRVSQAFAKIGDLVKVGSTTFRVEAG